MRYNNLLESINTKLVSDEVVSRRYSLSELISESYKLCYSCDEGTNLKKVAEAHLEDVRSNPKDIDRLSRQLCIITALSESKDIRDRDILINTTKRLAERSMTKRSVKDKKVDETYRPTSKLHVNEEDNPELTDEEVEELAKHLDSIRKERKSTTPTAKKEVTEDTTPRKGIRCSTHRSSVDETRRNMMEDTITHKGIRCTTHRSSRDIEEGCSSKKENLKEDNHNWDLLNDLGEQLISCQDLFRHMTPGNSEEWRRLENCINDAVDICSTLTDYEFEGFDESKKVTEAKTFSKKDLKFNDEGIIKLRGKDTLSTDPQGRYIYCDKNHPEDKPLKVSADMAVKIYTAYKNNEDYKKLISGVKESASYRGLSEFSKNSSTKPFYKTFKKMHESLKEGKALTRQESMNLYKAANSALTQLSVELEHNPKFLKTFSECTTLLSADVSRLLESMKNGKAPSKNTMKSLSKFSEALLDESDDPWEELDSLGVSEEEVGDIANKLGYRDGLTNSQAWKVVDYIKNKKKPAESSEEFDYKGVHVVKKGGKWVSSNGKNYMSYLTPEEIKQWIDKDDIYDSKKVTEAFPSRYKVIDDPSDKLPGDYSLNGKPVIIRKIGDNEYYIHDEHGNYDGITADAVRKYLKKSGANLENRYPYTDDDLSDSKKVNEAEDDDEEDIDVEDTEETEDDDFVGDDEGDVQSSEADNFDQEYADARFEMHKNLVGKHGDSEDPDVQEKIAQDAEEVTSLPGISEEQAAEINGQGEDPEEGDSEEDPGEDDGEVTDDELEELKRHLREYRRQRVKE